LFFVGIGTVDQDASLVSNGMIERDEIEDIKRSGGVGELLGHFFDEHGQPVETALSNRTLSVPREDLGRRRIVAVAGGSGKISAIRSILKSRTLGGLITDERTAMALVLESGGVAGSRI
jgi:DNA-binding transcriptional regulator LsrR (DeoR family)